ncbi:Sushi domain-containing protein 3 [Bagarius yarrelli]|uniref:Sushi domain-containing protein 3 n=1 Tax=Bagarius yarrelli TaxID=175774 RepID=A0A556U1Z3_BAGYA|nr:Sushi domain-containing protein 3 [Bagarius yarrelli]
MESKVTPGNRNWTVHPEGQCTPMSAPGQARFKIEAGNGTSVGTVMILVCPLNQRAINGGRISCEQESNITEWVGGIPECKSFTRLEAYHLALLLSIISTAIIMLMSIMFFTSWLLKCLKKEEMRQRERIKREENDRLWPQVNVEEQRESLYNDNSRFNYNNIQNNRSNSQVRNRPMVNCVRARTLQELGRCASMLETTPLHVNWIRSEHC